METKPENQWISDELGLLTPEWRPDTQRALALLNERLASRTRISPWVITAAVAATVCVAVLAIPETRAKAQGLWDHFILNRVDVIHLDLSDSPLQTHVTTNGMSQSARDQAEAEQVAGFKLYLPTGVLASSPHLTVTGPMVADQTVHVSEIESALAKKGATDVRVPSGWEGATLRAIIGPMVAADYPGEVQVLEARPFSLTVPSGFPLESFAAVVFRSVGVSSRDSAVMARKFAANPSWLLDIPADEVVNLQELSLANGPALLIEEYDDNTGAVARETVLRSTNDRIYAVMSPARDLSVRIASALP